VPAGVYEIPEDAPEHGDVDVIVNYTNCVQCGAITAKGGRLTTPEGRRGRRRRPLYETCVSTRSTLKMPVRAATPSAGAVQSERSATFAAEMTAMPGSVHMAIRIEIQEQLAGEALFHTVTASGLSAWRVSDTG
jgi:hypothetical protein